MTEHKNLQDVYEHLLNRNLSGAIDAMRIFHSVRFRGSDTETLNAIVDDFQLMADYWKKGYKDPQAETLYGNLLKRMYNLYVYECLAYEIGNSSFLSDIYNRTFPIIRGQSITELQKEMEEFVSEVAILELEPEHKRGDIQKSLYLKHHEMMNNWFDYIIISPVWNAGQTEEMERLLLSPTVDSNDQQVFVSSISIALVNHFDDNKLRLLLNVYQKATDEAVRQRALVGWAFARTYNPPATDLPVS